MRNARHTRRNVSALVALAVCVAAPVAFAQPKTAPKTAAPAASATAAAPPASATAEAVPGLADVDNPDASPKGKKADFSNVAPPDTPWDRSDVHEDPTKSYMFIGARYRGAILPKFLINLFVDEGRTVYNNTVGVEFDLRKDGFSFVPSLSYAELGTDDTLFHQKNTPLTAGNYTRVNSSLKMFLASVDLLWSTKISKNFDFEYGAGFGIGVVFGSLVNNWVQEDTNGKLISDRGTPYSPCPGPNEGPPGSGCNRKDHSNSQDAKVGNYEEPSWANGGSKPNIFPWISPDVGIRMKPIKEFEARVTLGFSLTGPWFGISGNYGLEKRPLPEK